jgi:hypothetical protein
MSVAFGTPQGVCAEKVRVEADRCNPARNKPSILPGGHAAVVITTAVFSGEDKIIAEVTGQPPMTVQEFVAFAHISAARRTNARLQDPTDRRVRSNSGGMGRRDAKTRPDNQMPF